MVRCPGRGRWRSHPQGAILIASAASGAGPALLLTRSLGARGRAHGRGKRASGGSWRAALGNPRKSFQVAFKNARSGS